MMAHEPIPFVLADPADDVDHGTHPVDSTYCRSCGGLGAHSPGCLVDVEVLPDVALVKAVISGARAAARIAHGAVVGTPAAEYVAAAMDALDDAISAVAR